MNTIINSRGTKLAQSIIGTAKDNLVKYGEEWVETMNKNHMKNRRSKNQCFFYFSLLMIPKRS
jgi:hypothetical protein